jgi:sugar phosphate isomerase/epimerase
MKLMLCSTGESKLLPFLPEIANLGVGIELGSYGLIGIRSEADWQMRVRLHQDIRAYFDGDVALHGPFIGMEYAHIDHLIREVVNRRLDMTFEAALTLRAKRVVLHSGFRPEIDMFKLWDTWMIGNIEFWQEEIRRWADAGISIVLENDLDQVPDYLVKLVDEVNHASLGLCLDIGHLNLFSQLEGTEWVRKMAGWLYHIHLHDNDGNEDKHWPIGRGMISFEPFFEAVMRYSPDATLSLEVQDDMEAKMQNLRWLANRFSS